MPEASKPFSPFGEALVFEGRANLLLPSVFQGIHKQDPSPTLGCILWGPGAGSVP